MGGHKKLTPKQFAAGFEEYCALCDEKGRHPTASGLAWHLGFASRQSLHDYKKDPDYAEIVGRAMLFVECGYEQQLADGRGDGGIVFALKNFGWSDKQELDHTSSDGSMSPRSIEEIDNKLREFGIDPESV